MRRSNQAIELHMPNFTAHQKTLYTGGLDTTLLRETLCKRLWHYAIITSLCEYTQACPVCKGLITTQTTVWQCCTKGGRPVSSLISICAATSPCPQHKSNRTTHTLKTSWTTGQEADCRSSSLQKHCFLVRRTVGDTVKYAADFTRAV